MGVDCSILIPGQQLKKYMRTILLNIILWGTVHRKAIDSVFKRLSKRLKKTIREEFYGYPGPACIFSFLIPSYPACILNICI